MERTQYKQSETRKLLVYVFYLTIAAVVLDSEDLVYASARISGEDVEPTGRKASSEQACKEDLKNGHPCHDEQRPEPHTATKIDLAETSVFDRSQVRKMAT
jgi:hypothetical protein